jgi:hypothetical protein
MKLVTIKEAKKIFCPLQMGICVACECMAFDEIHKEIKRENHSNGMQWIQKHRRDRGFQEIRREGVRNSCDELLILDSLYTCRFLYKDESN